MDPDGSASRNFLDQVFTNEDDDPLEWNCVEYDGNGVFECKTI